MASNLRAIVAAIQTTLQGIDGTADYVYDLADTADRVQVGLLPETPRRLSVWITDFQMRSSLEASLGRYKRTVTVQIEAAVPAATPGPAARAFAATDLCNDIHTALEADRTLGQRVLDITVDSTAFDGDCIGLDGFGIAAVVVTVWWYASGGI